MCKRKFIISVILLIFLINCSFIKIYAFQDNNNEEMNSNTEIEEREVEKEISEPCISYKAHIQNFGWQDTKNNGEIAGTTGEGLRLEALKIKLSGLSENININYQAHIENIGWQDWKNDNEIAGTEGKSLRVEAIRIKLRSTDKYSVMYRTHIQNIGWQDWKTDGDISGTVGKSLRIEAIEIKIVEKVKKTKIHIETPKNEENIYKKEQLTVSGWKMSNIKNTKIKAYIDDNEIAENDIEYMQRQDVLDNIYGYGTLIENPVPGFKFVYDTSNLEEGIHNIKIIAYTEGGKKLEEHISIFNVESRLVLSYSSHVQNIGWQQYVPEKSTSGTEGKSYRLEAIKIKLDETPQNGKVLYRTHIQNIGWQDWKANNQISGTEGQSLRIEAIQIKLENLDKYTVEYQVHIQDKGWSQWYIDGETAGTVGQSKRLEAIRIRIVPKYKRQYFGIDVSKYNGNVNWNAVKNSGIDFVMIRVGYRGYGQAGNFAVDTKFKQNIEGAQKAGLKVGIYFVTQAINDTEAIEEANWVINQIKDYNIDMPVAIDVEYSGDEKHNGRADNLDKLTRTIIIQCFCQRIQNAGYIPIIYLNVDWAQNFVNMGLLTEYDTWIANYKKSFYLLPSYNGNYTIWQYTSTGRVNGVEGDVDCNICYKKY